MKLQILFLFIYLFANTQLLLSPKPESLLYDDDKILRLEPIARS